MIGWVRPGFERPMGKVSGGWAATGLVWLTGTVGLGCQGKGQALFCMVRSGLANGFGAVWFCKAVRGNVRKG